ncbi:MAG: hypothetical protein J0H40_12800 [Rhizobiales bacterium]|nr:hypothetical protein [Hyphomicrobiales bacterium]
MASTLVLTDSKRYGGGIVPLSNADLDRVSGGFFPFIALGVALGIAYCIADGTLDPPPAPKGDFPTGPKNAA